MAQPRLRFHFSEYVGKGEVIVYSVLAILLLVTALATATIAGKMLWDGLSQRSAEFQILQVLDELLVVLMLVEVLHTVRISIRSHILVTGPFLVIGLIASIRRMLVITLEAANLTQGGAWTTQGQSVFRASMMELPLLGFLVLILVFSITLLRRYPAPPDEIEHM
jgi:hypothetical protein